MQVPVRRRCVSRVLEWIVRSPKEPETLMGNSMEKILH